MSYNDVPIFKIKDIIKLNREKTQVKTNNIAYYVISCRIKGESVFSFDKHQTKLKKGDILYIPYGSSYSQECDEEEIICFHLEGYFGLSNKIKIHSPQNCEKICSMFKKCYELWNEKPKNYKYKCMSTLYEILCELDNGAVLEKQKINPLFKSALDYLDHHIYDIGLNISNLCEKINMSRTYFNKQFRKYYDCTPVEYVNKQRIEKATMLLKSENYINDEIASLCGFSDVKYFYVIFKKYTGMSTKEYKKAANNASENISVAKR